MERQSQRQLQLAESNVLQKARHKRTTLRRARKSLSSHEKVIVLERLFTQRMFVHLMQGAEKWKNNQGAYIATQAGLNVVEESPYMEEEISNGNLKQDIIIARKSGISAKDLIDRLSRETKEMAYRANDRSGWTVTYFGHTVDLIVEVYPRVKSYGEEMKRNALNRILPLN